MIITCDVAYYFVNIFIINYLLFVVRLHDIRVLLIHRITYYGNQIVDFVSTFLVCEFLRWAWGTEGAICQQCSLAAIPAVVIIVDERPLGVYPLLHLLLSSMDRASLNH